MLALASALAVSISITLPMVTVDAGVLYAMAQKGEMPPFLDRLNPSYHVRRNDIAVSGALSVAVAIYFAAQVTALTAMVNFGALTSFALVNASVNAFFEIRRRSRRGFAHLLLALLGIVIIVRVLTQMSATGVAVGMSRSLPTPYW